MMDNHVDVVDITVLAVAVLVLGSMLLYAFTALVRRRPQKLGLLLGIVAVPMYAVYYNDQWPLDQLHLDLRSALGPLKNLKGADPHFISHIAPAMIIGILTVIRVAIFARVSLRNRLQRVHDPIANFFAGATFVTLVVGTVVSTFHWGWVGAVVLGLISALIYLGVLALLAAILEVVVEIAKFLAIWIKRKIFALATLITRIASWISSLGGRLVPRSLVEKLQADTAAQASLYLSEQDAQDRKLEEAYLRELQKRRARRGLPTGQLPSLAPEGGEPIAPSEMAAGEVT
jgi:hypothetical protein